VYYLHDKIMIEIVAANILWRMNVDYCVLNKIIWITSNYCKELFDFYSGNTRVQNRDIKHFNNVFKTSVSILDTRAVWVSYM